MATKRNKPLDESGPKTLGLFGDRGVNRPEADAKGGTRADSGLERGNYADLSLAAFAEHRAARVRENRPCSGRDGCKGRGVQFIIWRVRSFEGESRDHSVRAQAPSPRGAAAYELRHVCDECAADRAGRAKKGAA